MPVIFMFRHKLLWKSKSTSDGGIAVYDETLYMGLTSKYLKKYFYLK